MTSKLVQMQARFQQKQMQEKEEKLLKLYENQQQRAFDRVGRGSAGSNDSFGSTGALGGKVRQMFDERRQKAGIDKSYPLEPLKSKSIPRNLNVERKNGTTKTTLKSTVQNNVVKNGKSIVKKRETVDRLYENNNGKETYEETRYVDDAGDTLHSKSYREIMEMLDNNSTDSLENEQMPHIGFDERDQAFKAGKLYTSNIKNNNSNSKTSNGITVNKTPVKNPIPNGVTTKTENPGVKKNQLANTKRSPVQTSTSPKNSYPNSPAKKTSTVGTMNNKTKHVSQSRVPSSTRQSAKQQSPRSVVTRDDLTECSYCGRRFAEDRVQKHEEICSKTGKKKRKAYDATKHRVMGTELESYVLTKGPRSRQSLQKTQPRAVPKKDWRRTHEEFISTIRAAKEAQAHVLKGGKLSDLPPPPPSSNPDYVQCPHCNRRFNAAAAERHIPKCADYQFNKPKPVASRARPSKR